ncbi:surface protease GP63 [Trypanosoma theileri]|uniref:Leishmanolysin-like peptidase n=1 Tax=Trypanosoma theileri TaxID=67003 RepID=A0A1X0NE33_9TRYP|nr:surface protease GP63 [Trypanosoma theileri]ORC81751.1 surface protease GP63 [Trypanosoma theileri]
MQRLFLFAPLLLLYCTLVTLAVTEHHRCVFDRVSVKLGTSYDLSKQEKARDPVSGSLQTWSTEAPSKREEPQEGWEPIRIKLVFDNLKMAGHDCSENVNKNPIKTLLNTEFNCTDHDILTEEKKNILVNEILPEAINLHKERLLVKPLKGPIVVPEFSDPQGLCSKFIPKDHKTRSVSGYDMVLYVAATPTTDGAFAWAATCAKLDSDGRPVIGIINYGPRYIVATPQRVRVAAHEIAHALGFNFELMKMDRLVGEDDRLSDKADVFVVASKNTRREVMDHYNCNSTKGMELQSVSFVKVRKEPEGADGRARARASSMPAAQLQSTILAQVASVQEEYELGESHSNVMDGRFAGRDSVGSVVQERPEEEGSSAAKFTQNVHHSSNVFSTRRSLHVQAAMMASESKCAKGQPVETMAGETECIVEAPMFIPNHENMMTRSHWSRRIAKDELMVGLVGAGYYTAITMGAFADLGYYKVNWTMAEQMSWGNNSNCEFLNNKCVNSGETNFLNMFCTTKSDDIPDAPAGLQCTSDRQSMGRCSSIESKTVKDLPEHFRYFSENNKVGSDSSEHMDYCPFITSTEGYSCINGVQSQMPGSVIANNSRCVEGNELKAANAAVGAVCVEVSCKFNKVIVRYSGNNEWYSCPEGKNLTVNGSVLQGKIVCPKYADVCNTINKTLDESEGPSKDPDIVEEVQTSQPEAAEATGTPKPTESAAGNQGVSAPVVQNEASTTTESKPSETKEENNTLSASGQNNKTTAKKGTDGSFKASADASVMFVFLTLSMIMLP